METSNQMSAAVRSIVYVQEIVVGLDTEAVMRAEKETIVKLNGYLWSFDYQIKQILVNEFSFIRVSTGEYLQQW